MIMNNIQELPKHQYLSITYKKQNRVLSDIILKFKIIDKVRFWKKLAKKSKQRQNILKEWLQTEKNYLVSLGKIRTEIRDPLLQQQLINESQKNLMFCNIEAMQMLSQQMIQILKPHIAKWNPIKTKISDSVIFLANFFKVYKQYCNNYIQSFKIVTDLKQEYPDQINQIQLKLKMDISSYLIKPVQRPPKYKLLLESYKKQMRKNHQEFEELAKAIAIYHNVVEANNKDMELQEKKKKLLKLQNAYGNIIQSNARFLLLQTIGYINQVPVRIYIFNDLLMVTLCKDIKKNSFEINKLETEKVYSRVYYDAYSTLRKLRDGCYNTNGLVLIGKQSYIRLHFKDVKDRDNAFDQLNNFINDYYHGLQERQKLIFSNKTRVQSIVSRRFTNKSISIEDIPFLDSTERMDIQQHPSTYNTLSLQMIQNRNSGRKSTCMTKQRNQLIINDYKLERKLSFVFEFIGLEQRADIIYYIIAVETPLPVKQGQYLYLPFQILQDVEAHLVQLFPKQKIPTVGERPPTCTTQEIQNNFIKLHEERGLCIEAFLNFVFRNDNISHHINLVALKLGISQLLYQHMMDLDMHCLCGTCSQLEPILNDLNFQKYIDFQKSILQQLISNRKQKLCISTALQLLFKLQKLQLDNIKSLEQLLFYMSLKQRRLVAPYIFNNRTIHFVKELDKLPVHLPYDPHFKLMNKQVLKIPIYHYTTCRNIIQEIGAHFKVGALRDFAVCVKVTNPDKSQRTWILNDDEILVEVIKKGALIDKQQQRIKILQLEENQNNQRCPSCWTILMNSLKQSFGKTLQQQKPLLQFYIKKIVFLNRDLEQQACRRDNTRKQIIVAEILQRFKQSKLLLSLKDIKELCTYYYIIRNILEKQNPIFSTSKQELAKNFKQEYLKSILPHNKWSLLKEQFYQEIIERISQIYAQKSIDKSDVVLQSIFLKVVQFMSQKQAWCTQRFPVENQSQSLYGESKNLEIGINRNFLLICRETQAKCLVEIPLRKLNYRVAGLTLYINTEYTEYRFTGNNLGVIITIIEFYQNLPDLYSKYVSIID